MLAPCLGAHFHSEAELSIGWYSETWSSFSVSLLLFTVQGFQTAAPLILPGSTPQLGETESIVCTDLIPSGSETF